MEIYGMKPRNADISPYYYFSKMNFSSSSLYRKNTSRHGVSRMFIKKKETQPVSLALAEGK